MKWNTQQERSLQAVSHWLSTSSEQVFRLFGFAGTGKTTLAKYFAESVDGAVLFAAFAGKAAYVLQQKGCPATTIHKLIYIPKSKSIKRLSELKVSLDNVSKNDPEYIRIQKLISEEENNLSRPAFTLNLDSPLKSAKLLVLDEASQVNEEMAKDILSFGCKVLVLGDPFQLPPVYGTGYFTDSKPDIMLDDVRRQAKDSPIIWLSSELRDKRVPDHGEYGKSSVVSFSNMNPELAIQADQLIVGRNTTRVSFNNRIRQIKNLSLDTPEEGDRVVCLKNDHEIGLLNGGIWNIESCHESEEPDTICLEITPDEGGEKITVTSHMAHFVGEKLTWWDKNKAHEFDYGYAMTCHKAQGSQFDNVLVYNENIMRGIDQYKWRYTAVTRAAEQVHLVI